MSSSDSESDIEVVKKENKETTKKKKKKIKKKIKVKKTKFNIPETESRNLKSHNFLSSNKINKKVEDITIHSNHTENISINDIKIVYKFKFQK